MRRRPAEPPWRGNGSLQFDGRAVSLAGNRLFCSPQFLSCRQVSRLPWARGLGCKLFRRLRCRLGADKSPLYCHFVLLKRLWRPHQKIANSSCVSMTSQRATDTNQELRNIPTKLRYEKTRHIEM